MAGTPRPLDSVGKCMKLLIAKSASITVVLDFVL